VLERQLEQSRLGRALDRIAGGRTTVVEVARPTPLAFPLLVDRAREQLTSEKLADRIKRMITPLEKAADGSSAQFRRGGHRGFRSGGVV
jgi:ATP-dependent Lhr-like helicase